MALCATQWRHAARSRGALVELLSRLIGQMYYAVVDLTLSSTAFVHMCIFTNTERAVLTQEGVLEPTHSQTHRTYPDPNWNQIYLSTYMLINPARLATKRLITPGDAIPTFD